MWRGPMLHKALEQFLVDVHWGEPDFLLLDLPPGTGDVSMSIAQFLPRAEVLVVTTPQAAAERVAQRAAVMARQLRLPVRGVVENQSWFTGDDGKRYELFGHGGGELLAESLGVALLAQIPFLPSLRQGGDIGVPIAASDPDGEAGQAFAALAERVVALGPGRVYRSELSRLADGPGRGVRHPSRSLGSRGSGILVRDERAIAALGLDDERALERHAGVRTRTTRRFALDGGFGGPRPAKAREAEEEWCWRRARPGRSGAGNRAIEEAPDAWRTCFERDRDRILHSTAFRRLAGKTQVFIFPADHQRTRLTHALEVAQVATAIARACRLNVALTEAIALGHDCGHGPGGHASEEALSPFLAEGFDHAVWGADVTAAPLNLCAETLDGIRNHSWSRPAPATPEGEVVALADRIAYCAHDLEDAVHAEIVDSDDAAPARRRTVRPRRGRQLDAFVTDVVTTTLSVGRGRYQRADGRGARGAAAVQLRAHLPPPSLGPSSRGASSTFSVLSSSTTSTHPEALPGGADLAPDELQARSRAAVGYVSGMTDRFACAQAVKLLSWSPERLPRGIGA